MSKDRDSKKRVAFPIQLFGEVSSFAELPDEIHVVPTGKWSHPVYGEMEITSAHVAEFVRNFKEKVRLDLPITAGHDNGMNGGELEAVGWFKELLDRGVNGLYAVVEWTAEGERLLKARAFKYFSPEFYEEYSDPEDESVHGHVLVGGALTNKPYFKELDPVVAFSEPVIMSQFNQSMNLKDILSKKPEELSVEEKAFVKENAAELTDEQKETFKSALEDAPAPTPEPEPTPEPTPTPAPTPTVASEQKGKVITMSEAEVTQLRKAADDGAKALQKIEASEREAVVNKMIFSQSNTDGRFLPKQKSAIVDFVKALSEKQRDQFVNIVNNMPKVDTLLFKELGDGGSSANGLSGVAQEVDAAVKAAIKASEGKLEYSAALKQVFTEKPEMKEKYDAALAEGSN